MVKQDTFTVETRGRTTQDITEQVESVIRASGIATGLAQVFVHHTSASLVMSENWDPTARADLETFMERLVPEKDSWYTHDLEGPDDATSHIRAMLTDTSLTIPIDDGDLSLGTWQGIYVFEHRARTRKIPVDLPIQIFSVWRTGGRLLDREVLDRVHGACVRAHHPLFLIQRPSRTISAHPVR